MVTELEQLARRAVACKHWWWMPGMLAIMPEDRDGSARPERVSDDEWLPAMDSFPDLLDPATLGCLLALVRDAHRDPRMFVEAYSPFRDKWRCMGVSFSSEWVGPSEAEALVAALEAAP
jgi:hypothetical protein